MSQYLTHGAEEHFPFVHVMLQVWQGLERAGVVCDVSRSKKNVSDVCIAVFAKSSFVVDLLTWLLFQVLWYF